MDTPQTPRPQPLVLVVGGLTRSLVAFRGPLLDEMIRRGWRVVAAAGDDDPETVAELAERGIDFVRLPLRRTGMNPIVDLVTLRALVSVMRRVKPDIFLGYTIKPAVYGLIAARIAGTRRRVVMLEGLGYAFTAGRGIKRAVARLVATASLRLSLPFAHRAIFLNGDDRDWFVRRGLVTAQRTALVSGAGVDLDYFAPAPFPLQPLTFLMIARLLRDKGLYEYADAARLVRRHRPDTRFLLVGPLDTNPASVRREDLEDWVREGIIEYRGEVRDVRPAIAECHVYVLPSYREGLPRTVVEAMAMGRPIIVTDVPGCRDTVVDGVNGLLIPPRDSLALAAACERMIDDRDFMHRAGARSLEMCRQQFEADSLARHTAAIVAGATEGS